MADLVGTCPKDFWREWIAEGDAAGEPATGMEYGWWTNDPLKRRALAGDRFYVVAHGRLRGYAPIVRVDRGCIIRSAGAVAVTIPEPIQGFRGLRVRWWDRADEVPFPDWRDVAGSPLPLFAPAPEAPTAGDET